MALKAFGGALAGVAGEAARRVKDTAGTMTDSMMSVGHLFAGFVPDTSTLVDAFLKQSTAIVVPARCVPTGPHADDYELDFDVQDFVDARINGPFVRPNIQVSAATEAVSRDILAQRITTAFSVEMEKAEQESSKLQAQKGGDLAAARDEAAQDVQAGVEITVTLTVLGVILAVLGLGFIAPILALIGVANNIETAKSGIRLIILEGKLRLSKLNLWPTSEGKLSREIESERNKSQLAFKDAVAKMDIAIDDELVALAASFK